MATAQHAKVVYKSTDLITSIEEFIQLCKESKVDPCDVDIIKMEMKQQGLIAVGDNEQGLKVCLDCLCCTS